MIMKNALLWFLIDGKVSLSLIVVNLRQRWVIELSLGEFSSYECNKNPT